MADVVALFAYTGADQTVTIPTGATYAYIQCWGAGGATVGTSVSSIVTGSSGGGGYTDAYFSVSSYVGTSLKVIVGGGGKFGNNGAAAPATYGGGGSCVGGTNWASSSGGGRTAVRLYVSSSYVEIITAGGGGGGGQSGLGVYTNPDCNGGAGGGLNGGNADQPEGGFGGTQTAGGAVGALTVGTAGSAGSQYTGGGGATYSAGGGGGWYGGGAGGGFGTYAFGGGGGGSSHIDSTYTISGTPTTVTQGTLPAVANNSGLPSGVIGTIGNGVAYTAGSGNGKNGYVIVTFSTTPVNTLVTEPIIPNPIILEPINNRFMQLLMME
jgi:hypothetical protein